MYRPKYFLTVVGALIFASLLVTAQVAIAAPNVKLLAPNGGEKLISGEKFLVKWMVSDAVPRMTYIYLLRDGETAGKLLVTLSGKEDVPQIIHDWNWRIVENMRGSYRMRIVVLTTTNKSIEDVSDGLFAIIVNQPIAGENSELPVPVIRPNPVEMLCPNGNETYAAGESICISWQSRVANPLSAELWLSMDGGRTYPVVLADFNKPFANTSWIWQTKANAGTRLRVAIVVYTPSSVYFDASDQNFSILRKAFTEDADVVNMLCAPNPFNNATTINFSLSEASHVNLTLYDIMGRAIAELVDGILPAGQQIVHWNAATQVSGVYIAQLNMNGQLFQSKLLLIK